MISFAMGYLLQEGSKSLSARRPILLRYHPFVSHESKNQRIVIVGGGFAAVAAARGLAGKLPEGWEVVLYSEENHFVFTPLLTEVVGASINPLHCVWPLREMVSGVSYRTVPVVGLDLEAQELIYEERDGELRRDRWDHLVLAPGLAAHLDILPGLATHGWPLKVLGDALVLRNRLIGQLERAELEDDPEKRRRLLSFAVLGGGFTGSEVAGSMADLLKEASRFYERVDPSEISVHLVEMAPHILGMLPESLSEFAERKMRERGIDIRCGVKVESVSGKGLKLEGGETLSAKTVVAAVGNRIQPLLEGSGLPIERARLKVTPEMRVEGFETVWALGDCAAVPNAREGGRLSPPTAQYASRQGKRVAKNLLAVIAGREPKPFDYRPQGMFAAIGHRNAVGQVLGWKVSGFPAWFLWHGIYWSKMPTVTRKIQIALDWAINYLFRPDIVELSTLTTQRRGRVREEEFLRLAGESPELQDLQVRELMSRPVITLEPEVSIGEAIRRCRTARTTALPVVDGDGRMVGICTRSDLYRAVRALRSLETPVSEVMSQPVVTLRAEARFAEAVEAARDNDVNRLVIVEEGEPHRPVGMLSPFDVLGWLSRDRAGG